MSLVARKPVFGVSDQVRDKQGCTATQAIYVVKTKALISCAVTAQLICGFVLAYAKIQFSHDAAHIEITDVINNKGADQHLPCLHWHKASLNIGVYFRIIVFFHRNMLWILNRSGVRCGSVVERQTPEFW